MTHEERAASLAISHCDAGPHQFGQPCRNCHYQAKEIAAVLREAYAQGEQKGAREMREKAARIAEQESGGYMPQVENDRVKAFRIRALPLPGEETT